MKKEDFIEFLQACISDDSLNANFVAVCVRIEGMPVPEVIVNASCNLKYKLAYYDANYSDKLTYKLSTKLIEIVGWGAGSTPEAAFEMACSIDE